ncbi:MAG: hypothetical protein ACYS8Y_12015 [Planctomycetota bacterium]|jgi:hypothetical protein
MQKQKCIQCGSEQLEPGEVRGLYPLRFAPKNVKFLTFTKSAEISATVCLDCGSLMLAVDPSEVKSIKTH